MISRQERALRRLEESLRNWDDTALMARYALDRETQLKLEFRRKLGREPLLPPMDINDFFYRMKLYWRDPLALRCADKLMARTVVADAGLDYIISDNVIKVVKSADELDFTALPDSFFIQATHGSGFNLIVDDKNTLNAKRVRSVFGKALSVHYFAKHFEWVYEKAEPALVVSELFPKNSYGLPLDYKFYMIGGRAVAVQANTATEPHNDATLNTSVSHAIYNGNFDFLPLTYGFGDNERIAAKPANYSEMLEIAERLSAGFPHVRIDLYNTQGKIIFGEFTFFTLGGYLQFMPPCFDSFLAEANRRLDIAISAQQIRKEQS